MSYALAGTGIIHEFLNDEVIIANLDDGIYYSIRGSGITIWQLLLSGHSLSSIESLFSEKYGEISSIAPFVERLLEEKLLRPNNGQDREFIKEIPCQIPDSFQLPVLERYDEMKNLLMLDPIHEVDEQGWPRRK